jgi:hypothetical protein
MECEFCKKTLSNKSNLTNHQKTNKKCLSAQEKEGRQLNEIKLNECVFCNKIFSEQNLKIHLLCCKKKKIKDSERKIDEIEKENKRKIEEIEKEYERKIEKLEKENEKLKNELEICGLRKELEIKDKLYKDEHNTIKKIALQPRTNTNNNTNNTNNIIGNLNLSDTERIKGIIEREFTTDDILDGQKGLANFAFQKILKDENGNLVYACVDSSRKMFKFKDVNGNVIKDINTQKLTEAFVLCDISNITNSKSQEFWANEDGTQNHHKYNVISNPAAEIMNLKYNNITFREQLVNLTTS